MKLMALAARWPLYSKFPLETGQGGSTLMALPVLLFLPPPPPLVRVSSRKWRCSRVANSLDANQRALAVRIFNIFNDLIRKINAC